jgi:hypothetical protein
MALPVLPVPKGIGAGVAQLPLSRLLVPFQKRSTIYERRQCNVQFRHLYERPIPYCQRLGADYQYGESREVSCHCGSEDPVRVEIRVLYILMGM